MMRYASKTSDVRRTARGGSMPEMDTLQVKSPPSVLARMDGTALAAMRDDEAARASGKDVKTDWQKFLELKDLAATQPAKFADVYLPTYFGQLADTREQLINLQDQIKRPDGRNDG